MHMLGGWCTQPQGPVGHPLDMGLLAQDPCGPAMGSPGAITHNSLAGQVGSAGKLAPWKQPSARKEGPRWDLQPPSPRLGTLSTRAVPSGQNPRCPQRKWLTARALRPPASRTSLRTSSREMPVLESLQSVRCRGLARQGSELCGM